MPFKPLNTLKKAFCSHNWGTHAKAEREDLIIRLNTKKEMETVAAATLTTEVLICRNCGKITKITY